MLTNKYLKYSPEITLEIFTLIYNKLIECGLKSNSINVTYGYFSNKYPFLTICDVRYFFTRQKDSEDLLNKTETTVQEILGYDPFVKDDFVLPEKWYIEVGHNSLEINKWKKTTAWKSPAESFKYVDYRGVGIMSTSDLSHCTKITFDQFKKYVLKTTEQPKVMETKVESKDVIPEYVECINKSEGFTIGKIYKTDETSSKDWYNFNLNDSFPTGSFPKNFKPSTKEAFNAQNKPKPIEKWSVGTYVLFLKDLRHVKAGHIDVINKSLNKDGCIYLEKYLILDTDRERQNTVKWFATKSEAEEFAKTLVNPIEDTIECEKCNGIGKVMIAKLYPNGHTEVNEECPACGGEGIIDKPKQPLKQAVHCKTQEEWDFVKNKIDRNNDWQEDYPCQILVGKTPWKGGIQFCIDEGIQILSFQEWCDLNGYKMDNKFKFEIGKWYIFDWKFNKKGKVLLKVSGIRDTCIETNNRVYLWDNSVGRGRNGYLIGEMSNIKELSIEEIQQYLPDNHPDKIRPSNNLEDMNITELHEKGLIKDFFYEVIGESIIEDALDEDGDLCEYGKFDSMNCIGISCSECLLHKNNRSKLTELLKPKESNDFKVGDRVIGWHLPGSDLNVTPWVIGRIQGEYAFPTGHSLYCTYFKDIRHISESKEQLFPIFEEKSSIQIKEIEIKQNYFIDFKDPYS